MDEQRKYAILFAATILAARKLNDFESKPWGITSPLFKVSSDATTSGDARESKRPVQSKPKVGGESG